jgi:hypothetical protein
MKWLQKAFRSIGTDQENQPKIAGKLSFLHHELEKQQENISLPLIFLLFSLVPNWSS